MKRFLVAFTAVMLLVAAGCTKTVPITIKNTLGDYDISAVYIFPTTQASRGEDLQATDLAPDQSAVFQMLPGTYNILILDEDEDSYYFENVTVPDEGYSLEVTLDDLNWEHVHVGTGHYPLNITNKLVDYDFWYLYIDPTGTVPTTEYMGSNIIFPDETITVWLEPGSYDIQVVDDTDFTYTFTGVAVAETAATNLEVLPENIDTPRPAEVPTTVTIVNGLGNWDILYAYVDPSDAPWTDDRLGDEILVPGASFVVDITTGTWDMKVEDVDGDTYSRWMIEIGPEGYVWEVTLDDMD
jgi:hypothetical protein